MLVIIRSFLFGIIFGLIGIGLFAIITIFVEPTPSLWSIFLIFWVLFSMIFYLWCSGKNIV